MFRTLVDLGLGCHFAVSENGFMTVTVTLSYSRLINGYMTENIRHAILDMRIPRLGSGPQYI